MSYLTNFFAENQVLVIFVVIALGYPLGRLKLGSLSLGVAAVLFAGLAVGAFFPGVKPPEALHVLGLSLFVYAIGLSSGPSFVSTIKEGGITANIIALTSLVIATLATVAAAFWLSPQKAAGLFSGALTNTPALAGVAETLRQANDENGAASAVMAYSIAYPFAVAIGTFLFSLAAGKFSHLFGTDPVQEELRHTTVRVMAGQGVGLRLGDLIAEGRWHVAFGRLTRNGVDHVVFPDERLKQGDLITFVGPIHEVDHVCQAIGEEVESEHSRRDGSVDVRRIFLSNRKLAGRSIEYLQLEKRFGARVTRVRRGDTDIVPQNSFVVELGDRLRVVAPKDVMGNIGTYLGDSYQAVGELEMLSFALGHAFGLLVGALSVTIAGITLKLGFAGGPLIIGLLLGALRRTGSLVWQVPHAANMAVRQIGLSIFLAGIGLRAGGSLGSVHGSDVAGVAGFAILITTIGIGSTLLLAAWWLKSSPARSCGMAAAIMTQPALLAFGQERFGCGPVDEGYAAVYPLSMIAKVLLAQLILLLAR